jgi:hypothetical protein
VDSESLRSLVDDYLEHALVDHESVKDLLHLLLPKLQTYFGATGLSMLTYCEDLELRVFGSECSVDERKAMEQHRAPITETSDCVRLYHPLDVAGEWFGCAMLTYEQAPNEDAAAALNLVCEQLDNHLYGVYAARKKHDTMLKVAHALRERVMRDGLLAAIKILAEVVPFRELVLVYASQEADTDHLHFFLFRGAELAMETAGADASSELERHVRAYFDANPEPLLKHLGLSKAKEELLINPQRGGWQVSGDLGARGLQHL